MRTIRLTARDLACLAFVIGAWLTWLFGPDLPTMVASSLSILFVWWMGRR